MKKTEPRIKGCHSGLGNGFLDMTPAQQAKEKIDKLDNIKIKNFCTPKNSTKKVKRQSREWEKIFAYLTSDRRLVSRINTLTI